MAAGRSVAVQGCNENAGMLLMLILYAAGTAAGISVAALVITDEGFAFEGDGPAILVGLPG